jgi:anaerobic selenocysteine-containing dehydrogenase
VSKPGDLIRVETEIGYFIDKAWVTEGIKPGIVAMSHHLGRWRLQEECRCESRHVKCSPAGRKRCSEHKLNIIKRGESVEDI